VFAAAEAAAQAERARLNALLGLTGKDAHWTAQAALPEPLPIDGLLANLEQRALTQSLDLHLLRQQAHSAEERASLATWQGWIPELKAGVSAEREEGRWALGPAAAVELPIFYQGQGESGALKAEARRAHQVGVDVATRIQAEARASASQLNAAAAGVTSFKYTVLPLREQIVQATLLEYNAMSVGLFEVLQAKRDQIAAGESYVQLLLDYWVARASVEQLIAGRLPSSSSARTPPRILSADASESARH
jgi:cobalt-zinc-cadmium efflux system outer membrane protein